MVKGILEQIFNEVTKSKINILSSITIKPSDIKPFPKACARKTHKRSKLGKSRIYTSTPEKERIEELEKARFLKLEKTNAKRKITILTEKSNEENSTKKQQKLQSEQMILKEESREKKYK